MVDQLTRLWMSFAPSVTGRLASERDGGQSDALNRAIGRAHGDLVVWLNADDLLVPGAFAAAQAALIRQPEAAFVFGDFDMVDANGATVRTFRSAPYELERVFTHGCYIFSGAIFYRRELLERVGPFDVRLHACMDFDYLMRIGAAKAVHVGRTVAQFRINEDQKSATMRSRFLKESYAIRRQAAGSSMKLRLLALLLTARDSAYLVTAQSARPVRGAPYAEHVACDSLTARRGQPPLVPPGPRGRGGGVSGAPTDGTETRGPGYRHQAGSRARLSECSPGSERGDERR